MCSAWLLAAAAFSAAAQDVPTGPAQPSSSTECVDAFAAAFSRHFRDNVCHACDDMEGFPGARWAARYTACYRGCSAVKRARLEALSSARSACFERAKRYASEQEQEKLHLLEGMKAGEKVAKAFEKAIGAYEAANDPKRFFQRALKKLPSAVRRHLADAQQAEPMTVEAQVHAFTSTWARDGIEAASRLRGRSGVIGAIQRESLDRLLQVHGGAVDDLNFAFDNANRALASTYGAPASSFRATPVRSLGPAPRARPPRQGAECNVLSTPEGADLANDVPDRYEELTRRCRGGSAGNR
jgi:hypothetical protein